MPDYFTTPPRLSPHGRTPRSVAERFWNNVLKTNGCWLWQGATGTGGYGGISIGSLVDGTSRTKLAHRLSWEMHNGPILDGMDVCHTCDIPACVRPDHLFLGTRSENMLDAAQKGRRNAKLAAADVLVIRHEWATGTVHQTELAARFGVCPSVISGIVRREAWKHI